MITWYRADWWILILVSMIGASGSVVGEIKKLRFIDDDFMIQMLPAMLILLLWQGFTVFGINILPPKIILPI
jgi:uncharacterized membrane protein